MNSMSLSLYDTLSRKILPVRPIDGETLRFYCWGPMICITELFLQRVANEIANQGEQA